MPFFQKKKVGKNIFYQQRFCYVFVKILDFDQNYFIKYEFLVFYLVQFQFWSLISVPRIKLLIKNQMNNYFLSFLIFFSLLCIFFLILLQNTQFKNHLFNYYFLFKMNNIFKIRPNFIIIVIHYNCLFKLTIQKFIHLFSFFIMFCYFILNQTNLSFTFFLVPSICFLSAFSSIVVDFQFVDQIEASIIHIFFFHIYHLQISNSNFHFISDKPIIVFHSGLEIQLGNQQNDFLQFQYNILIYELIVMLKIINKIVYNFYSFRIHGFPKRVKNYNPLHYLRNITTSLNQGFYIIKEVINDALLSKESYQFMRNRIEFIYR